MRTATEFRFERTILQKKKRKKLKAENVLIRKREAGRWILEGSVKD